MLPLTGTKGKLALFSLVFSVIGERGRKMEKESMNWTLAKSRSALSYGHFLNFFFFWVEEKLKKKKKWKRKTLYQAGSKKINKPSVPPRQWPNSPWQGKVGAVGNQTNIPFQFPSICAQLLQSITAHTLSWPFLHRRRLQIRDSLLSGEVFEGWLKLQWVWITPHHNGLRMKEGFCNQGVF